MKNGAARLINKAMEPVPLYPKEGDEYFANGIFMFNISELIEYIQINRNGFVTDDIDVKGYYQQFKRKEFDRTYVEKANLEEPVILAEIAPDRLYHGYPGIDDEYYSRGYNLIDGHHRLFKAYELGYEKILAYIVPMEKHLKFMYSGFLEYMGYWNNKLEESTLNNINF